MTKNEFDKIYASSVKTVMDKYSSAITDEIAKYSSNGKTITNEELATFVFIESFKINSEMLKEVLSAFLIDE